jgi:hypothetical protein
VADSNANGDLYSESVARNAEPKLSAGFLLLDRH